MKILRIFVFILFSLILNLNSIAQTIGLQQHNQGSYDDGYILFAPDTYTDTYLIDKCGKLVNSWSSTHTPGNSVYLLPDGNLLRCGTIFSPFFMPVGGIIEKFDWNSNLIWSYVISDSTNYSHHDIKPMPNGNILVIAWEKKTTAQAIAAGINPDNLIGGFLDSEQIIELQPYGTDSAIVVWRWHLWDHLVQDFDSTKMNYGQLSLNPQLLDINFLQAVINLNIDWVHMNSVDYNPVLDQIMVSSRNASEIWIIDHSTTTIEAAGHTGGNHGKGGDFLYRWGNPSLYGKGTVADKKFFGQHSAHWVESGLPNSNKIMVYNNGWKRPDGNYSSVELFSPPVDAFGNYQTTLPFGPDSVSWKYKDSIPENFYSSIYSGAQQLNNGNIIICNGENGVFFEIDSNKKTVWKYINPVTTTGPMSQGSTPIKIPAFRCVFYNSDYSGFSGRSLVGDQPIELNPLPYSCILDTSNSSAHNTAKDENMMSVFPNPACCKINITKRSGFSHYNEIEIYNLMGKRVLQQNLVDDVTEIDIADLASGLYLIKNEDHILCFIKD